MMESNTVWNNQDPTLSIPSQDDFQQFLDMENMGNLGGELHFAFQDYGHQQIQGGQMMHQNGSSVVGGQDTTMQELMPSMTTTSSHSTIPGSAIHAHPSGNDSLSELDAQIQYLQHQRSQQQQRQMQEQQRGYYAPNAMIPPTPNSIEMHSAGYRPYPPQSDPQQQAMYERYQMQLKDSEMAFTPLVSPAVTPLETHFNIPEYTVPGAYFSPLSSPALHAQNEHSSVYDTRQARTTTNSPIDLLGEPHIAPPGSGTATRKPSARKAAVQKPRSVRGVRQSPIVKPRKSKRSSTVISAQALGDILEPPSAQGPSSKETTSSNSTISTEESENGSISPEHLSDMAPPPIPVPGSAGRSPFIQAQINARTERLALGSPATPASLMRLTQSPNSNQPVGTQDMDVDEHGIESFLLPEAANGNRPPLTRIETVSDGQMTPTLSSSGAKTPGLQPLPSPAFKQPKMSTSATASPQIVPVNGTSNNLRRAQNIAPRGSSKRRSSNSVLASPALLPRISPSIKPLLPGGTNVAEDTASMLLATKSNYQNILEGTHLPGVSYPSELSTNLTSKRTSHKIAEQGRRNRINSALQEIATLLPKSTKDSSGEKSGSGETEQNENGGTKGAAQSANSKASTVEQAIEYIKQLKQDLADAQNRADLAEKQLLAKT